MIARNLVIDFCFGVVFAFFVLERIVSTFMRPAALPTEKIHQKNIFFVLLSIYLLAVILSVLHYLQIRYLDSVLSGLGVALLAPAIVLRTLAIKNLGPYWSPFVEIKKGHRLITTGIYKSMRHPYYISVVLELSGIALICNAYGALMLVMLVQAPLLLTRALLEEKTLREVIMPDRILRIFLFSFYLALAAGFSAYAASYDLKEMTPEVQEATANRQDRYDTLESMKARRDVGEDNRGYAKALVSSPIVAAAVASENHDRGVIYNAIAQQNNLGPGGLEVIELFFAGVQRDKAEKGDSIQLPSGQWVDK